MFERLTDLSFQRTRKQAVGFYLASLFSGCIFTAVILFIYVHVNHIVVMPKGKGFQENFSAGLVTVQVMGTGIVHFIIFAISTILAALVARAKNAYNGVSLVCIILTAVLSFAAVLSFIPIAYLTTLPKSASQGN